VRRVFLTAAAALSAPPRIHSIIIIHSHFFVERCAIVFECKDINICGGGENPCIPSFIRPELVSAIFNAVRQAQIGKAICSSTILSLL
jgi:hypothetical protein